MSSGIEREFERRWTALGLAQTAVAHAPDATLRPATLPLAQWTPGAGSQPAEARPDRSDAFHLPRISVDLGTPSERAPASGAATRADLCLMSTLGEGGMGRVYLARQRSLGRDVAIKALKEHAKDTAASALLHEARLTGSLEHPGVIPVHALGLDDAGRPVLVMKRVDGVEWRELLRRPDHPLLVKRGAKDALALHLEILIQLCQTLEFAHSRGIVHLDLKPENVMVGEYGEVYLVDWGIARALDSEKDLSGSIVGTPAYMAPEMVLGKEVGTRTDVYLLGATLHEVLTGRLRHDGSTLESVLLSAALSRPVTYDAEVPEALAGLANRATARDGDERPESAEAFRRELADFLRLKSANLLAETAAERVDELERLLEPEGPPADLARAHRLATEARFGFAQALREHADHQGAKLGRERALAALIELELRQEHADTARALLCELSAPPDGLAERVEAAERRAAERGRDRARLQALERDQDPTVEAGARGLAVIATLLLILSVSAYAVLVAGVRNIDGGRMLGISVFLTSAICVGAFVARRALTANAFNRRMAGLLLAATFGTLFNRSLAVAFDTPVATTATTDLAIFLGVATGAAVGFLPSLWPAVVLYAGGIAGIRARPDLALPLFASTTVLSVAVIGFALWREVRKRRNG